MVESGVVQPRGDAGVRAIDVSRLDEDLLDATVRLLRLDGRPGEYRALAPPVLREIVYRLLGGEQGSRTRRLATFGGAPWPRVGHIGGMRAAPAPLPYSPGVARPAVRDAGSQRCSYDGLSDGRAVLLASEAIPSRVGLSRHTSGS